MRIVIVIVIIYLSHGSQKPNILDVLQDEILSPVVHPSFLQQQFKQRNGLLRSVLVNLRHVHVVHEYQETFAGWWAVGVLGALLHVGLQVALDIHGSGS